MQITIENTKKVVTFNNVPCRIWEGKTSSGIEVICFIPRIAISKDENEAIQAQFADELDSMKPPSKEVEAFPARLIL